MRTAYSGVRFSVVMAAAAVTLGLVVGCLGALSPGSALSASTVSSVVSTGGNTVRTSVAKVGGKSYLMARVTNGSGAAQRFAVRQRVCRTGSGKGSGKESCRTAEIAVTVPAGQTAWKGRYLGPGAYGKEGAPAVVVTAPRPAKPTSAPTVTATVTARPVTTPTVTVTAVARVTATATVTAVVTATATVTATVTAPPPVPGDPSTVTPAPTLTITPSPTVPPVDTLCGAPANPHGFTFCDTGRKVYAPAPGACEVFACIRTFPNGRGYLVLCGDGWVSLSGGLPGTCSSHKGWSRDIYQRV